jgi:hypothetical protein
VRKGRRVSLFVREENVVLRHRFRGHGSGSNTPPHFGAYGLVRGKRRPARSICIAGCDQSLFHRRQLAVFKEKGFRFPDLARVGPTTPRSLLPHALSRPAHFESHSTLFASEQMSPSARERLPWTIPNGTWAGLPTR